MRDWQVTTGPPSQVWAQAQRSPPIPCVPMAGCGGPGGLPDITFWVVKSLLAQSQPGPLSKAHRIDFSTSFLFISWVFDGPVTHSQPCQNFLHLDNIWMTNAYDTWGDP